MNGETVIVLPGLSENGDSNSEVGDIQITLNPDYDDHVSSMSSDMEPTDIEDGVSEVEDEIKVSDLDEKVDTSSRIFKCPLCKNEEHSPENLKEHFRQYHSEILDACIFHCQLCTRPTRNIRSLDQHMKLHSKSKKFTCHLCLLEFHYEIDLHYHLEHRHPEVNFNGTDYREYRVEEHFALKKKLNEAFLSIGRMKIETSLKAESVDAASSVNGETLSQSKQISNDDTGKPDPQSSKSEIEINESLNMTFKCHVCKSGFDTRDELYEHATTLSHRKQRMFVCLICNQGSPTYRKFSVHIRRHTGEKAFLCDICGVSFKTNLELTLHQKIHVMNPPYYCYICDKRFSLQSMLANHMKYLHRSGEKRFKCGVCEKGFTHKAGLVYHQRTRTGENCTIRRSSDGEVIHEPMVKESSHVENTVTIKQLLQQKVCGEGYTLKTGLVDHQRTQTGENSTIQRSSDGKVILQPIVKESSPGENTVTVEQPLLQVKSLPARSMNSLIKYIPNKPNEVIRTPLTLDQKLQIALSYSVGVQCLICIKTWKNLSLLKSHMTEHTTQEIDALVRSLSKSSSDGSLKISTTWKPYSCTECGLECTTPEELKIHMLSHSNKTMYVCNLCGKCFANSHHLYEHLHIHTGEKQLIAGMCEKEAPFSDLHDKTRHKDVIFLDEKHSETPINNDAIKIISVTSLANADMNPTLSKETKFDTLRIPENKFGCVQCDLWFPSTLDLQIHRQVHEREGKHKCNICSKSYSRSSDLKIHVRKHTGEMPYQCKICKKSFISKEALRYHEKNRTQKNCYRTQKNCYSGASKKRNKSHQCLVCLKTFSRNNSLQSHLRTHTGEKPFKCKICEKRFTSKTGLNRHVKNRTPENCWYKKCDVQANITIMNLKKLAETRNKQEEEIRNKQKGTRNHLQIDDQQILVFPKTPVVNVKKTVQMQELLNRINPSDLPEEAQNIINCPDAKIE